MKTAFLELDFGKLYYRYINIGKENTIIFLHGNASSSASFINICELLKDDFNLICLDFPGHGLSEHIDITKYSHYYSLVGLRDILRVFYKQLELSNVYIAGNSLGANIAVQSLPKLKNIKGLILMASIHARNKESFFSNILPTAPTELSLKNKLNNRELYILTRAFIHESKSQLSCFAQMYKDIKDSDGCFRTEMVKHMNIQKWLDEPQLLLDNALPILFIGGAQDAFINPIYYKTIQKQINIASSHIKLLDQVSHVPHLEDPGSCAKIIKDFIAGKF